MRWALLLVAALGLCACSEQAQDHLRKARDLAFEKKPEQALAQYRLALDLIERDGSGEAQVQRARALKGAADTYYLELRDFRRAAEVYRELIRVCPEAPETLEGRIQLANLLHTQFRDLRGAISLFTSAIERNAPQSAELSYEVAKLYFELGDFEQATVEAARVQEKYETSAFVDDALLLEAQALLMMEGRAQDGQRALLRLVEKFPDSELVPHALYELGKLKAEQGQREEAIALFVRALKRHPDPALVQDSITRIRRQIDERTPVGVGQAASAFEHPPAKSSGEAMGLSPEEAARESGL